MKKMRKNAAVQPVIDQIHFATQDRGWTLRDTAEELKISHVYLTALTSGARKLSGLSPDKQRALAKVPRHQHAGFLPDGGHFAPGRSGTPRSFVIRADEFVWANTGGFGTASWPVPHPIHYQYIRRLLMPLYTCSNDKLTMCNIKLRDKEKSLQRLIEKNLQEVLEMRFIASEYRTTSGGRIDTLAVDLDGAPVIIEYKRNRVK